MSGQRVGGLWRSLALVAAGGGVGIGIGLVAAGPAGGGRPGGPNGIAAIAANWSDEPAAQRPDAEPVSEPKPAAPEPAVVGRRSVAAGGEPGGLPPATPGITYRHPDEWFRSPAPKGEWLTAYWEDVISTGSDSAATVLGLRNTSGYSLLRPSAYPVEVLSPEDQRAKARGEPLPLGGVGDWLFPPATTFEVVYPAGAEGPRRVRGGGDVWAVRNEATGEVTVATGSLRPGLSAGHRVGQPLQTSDYDFANDGNTLWIQFCKPHDEGFVKFVLTSREAR